METKIVSIKSNHQEKTVLRPFIWIWKIPGSMVVMLIGWTIALVVLVAIGFNPISITLLIFDPLTVAAALTVLWRLQVRKRLAEQRFGETRKAVLDLEVAKKKR